MYGDVYVDVTDLILKSVDPPKIKICKSWEKKTFFLEIKHCIHYTLRAIIW